mmetsp:Transcript_9199/g.21942  ORF Transcript_9199/g.21942 Transcript_9199/m.21942 type:complete len:381 (-) Transcript_9199:1084-2226(-)
MDPESKPEFQSFFETEKEEFDSSPTPHKPTVVPPDKIKPAIKRSIKAETPPEAADREGQREWEHKIAQSKLETEVYRGALVSQIETTKKALSDAANLSHVLVTTKSALEESMATMVVEIQTQTEQIKSLKETVAMSEEELNLCHKMLDDRDARLQDTEIELEALEKVHSELMDAREIRIEELEKDLDIYKKVFGEMLDEKDLQLAELEEELRALKEMHGELLEMRQKEEQQNALLDSVFSRKVDTTIDYDDFEKAEQALEDEYGPVGIEQETRLDLLLTALSSSENEIGNLKTQIEASTMFNSTITMPAGTEYTGTTADSSQLTEGDETSDTAMIQRLQQKIKELDLKSYHQEQTIDALQEQVNSTDAFKLKESGAEILL